ncbi:hypothetical protein F5Y11DRAFT_362080 [Daldinia sp. FL1419]|nr:hypothetical protein F5Y11DRAFT_362080 [Daldinia sp. FL1419]
MDQKPKTFLDLPLAVRQKIYLDAGIPIGSYINVGERPSIRGIQPHTAESERFIYSILQTCKTIHDEAKSLLLEKNTIFVDHMYLTSGLEFLCGLSPQHCSSLTRLVVWLHSRYDPPPGRFGLQQEHIDQWQEAIENILSNTIPGKLKLYLMCDTMEEDMDSTSAVLQPLLDRPGILAECELRLHDKYIKHISDFAKEMALRIKGVDSNPQLQTFPYYMSLPTEIRQRILEYTDLVTPKNEVEWFAATGFQIKRCWGVCPDNCRGCRYISCFSVADQTPNLFCSRMHSSYSPYCECWVSPLPMMLVNHTMYQDACDVFYYHNRVILRCESQQNTKRRMARVSGRLRPRPVLPSVSQFFSRCQWPNVLSRLRSLEIKFDPIARCEYPTPPHRLYTEWSQAIELIKAHVNIAKLEISVYMEFRNDVYNVNDANYFCKKMDRVGNDADYLFNVHKRLLEPFQELQEMKSFYVYLERLWHLPTKDRRILKYGPRNHKKSCVCGDCRVEEVESYLERFVMGDEYDSFAVGKSKQRLSNWLIMFYRLC